MPKRKVNSVWRSTIYKKIGLQLGKEIRAKMGTRYFIIRTDLSPDGVIPMLAHCKPSTRHQYLTAICSELQSQGKLKRNGKTYYFPAKGSSK